MQDFFLENPVALAVLGSLLVVVIGFVWVQTASRSALYAAAITLLLTIGLVILSVQVETDQERIRRTIVEVAGALEANDFERVYSYIDENASAGVTHARSELPQFEFTEARVTGFKSSDVNRDTHPPTAVVEFNVVVSAQTQGQTFRVLRFVRVFFIARGERWLVRDYEHFEPTAGFRDTNAP